MGMNPVNYTHLTASANVRTKPGVLRGFHVASTNVGTIKFYDGQDNAGTPITGVITPAAGVSYPLFDVALKVGLYVEIAGTALDVMVASGA